MNECTCTLHAATFAQKYFQAKKSTKTQRNKE